MNLLNNINLNKNNNLNNDTDSNANFLNKFSDFDFKSFSSSKLLGKDF